jgi:hypothetical protein
MLRSTFHRLLRPRIVYRLRCMEHIIPASWCQKLSSERKWNRFSQNHCYNKRYLFPEATHADRSLNQSLRSQIIPWSMYVVSRAFVCCGSLFWSILIRVKSKGIPCSNLTTQNDHKWSSLFFHWFSAPLEKIGKSPFEASWVSAISLVGITSNTEIAHPFHVGSRFFFRIRCVAIACHCQRS